MPSFLNKPEPLGGSGRRRRKRLWVLPPLPVFFGQAMEGSGVLDEVNATLSVTLWQALRDFYLWATTIPSARANLFGPVPPPWFSPSELPEALSTALTTWSEVVAAPGEVPSSTVATACLSLSSWAAEHGYPVTEQGFAEVAAIADLEDPECAYVAGRAARRRGMHEAGREWFRRSIGLARRSGDDAAYALAYIGWALLEDQCGNEKLARAKLVKAWRAAKRGGVRRLMGMVRQAMIPYAVADGDRTQALRHAVAASKLYGWDEDDLPRLSSDTGALLSLDGYFSTAIKLYEAALPRLLRPADRVAAIANIARAAAAVGRRDRFEQCWELFQSAVAEESEYAVASMLEIAAGARTLGQVSRARGMIREAERIAAKHVNSRLLEEAQRMDSALRNGEPADRDRKPPVTVRRFAARLARRVEKGPP